MATIKTTSKKTALENPASSPEESISENSSGGSSNQESYEMIQQAAYFIAENNSFAGDSVSYWLEAEAQVKGAL
ncbi:DUF2934 domain-containing protein [Methylotenera sp.]|uniref:DUF2934 domain-containing protein n=1 Tax=Methylotenera sp. TaxID=2051956 RepID=UPI002732E6FD|nr:DUF2934 domain-containing protein [Methylotenera sp.]MDP3307058.1 DUF2934 domain-containing protein [Methylotenera sp.]